MTDLVTLAEAKAYCRVDGSDDDAVLAVLISAASEAVLEAADPNTAVPGRLKLAVLSRVAESFDKRGEAPEAKNENVLTFPFSSYSTGAAEEG
jgi:hypothetical protein